MSLNQPDIVTLWVLRTDAPETVAALFTTPYTEDGDATPSAFMEAYRLPGYDEDFAELHLGGTAEALIQAAASTWRTLDEQALSRLPTGAWNGLYLLSGQAGDEWTAPERRPPMPHGEVQIGEVVFRLVDSCHVLVRP
ncbi:immunity 22 family protein [Deinococcus soli (ex Cha et al. 2016)]|uniref:immunity 22 family protein n=1 Tax=Deinococcus soli (ex Cha et al. 2016) TaxID=1309411 RepID=UPI001664FADE|nr:immunity 22 family protein [Deinococcus soli (ex Cha et al. 2016)]